MALAARERDLINNILAPSGVILDGPRPYDPQVHTDSLFKRILRDGPIAIGESYMDAEWDANDLVSLIARVSETDVAKKFYSLNYFPVVLAWLKEKVLNRQSEARAYEVGEKHYDIGNDLYERMLDKRLTYSCGYWKDAKTLDEAQEAKLDLICRKIGLKPGDRVLDIGCGWGSFAIYAAEKYGAKVVGVTISKEQVGLAQERAKELPVEIRLQDYRTIDDGPYDRIVSVGMFEHVGHKNYRTYMETARRLLKEDGLFLLHTIGSRETRLLPDPWLDKYIFPNGILPSAAQITAAIDKQFVLEDWHAFGPYYEKTLLAWYENFNSHWDEIKDKYGERFYRMWKFYLLACAGNFRSRNVDLWQLVLSPHGVRGGYTTVR
jgi:cyclopropane-fatty-acyl-phospholipid synthase